MKIFWRYFFPALFGLLIYTCVRLVNDTTLHKRFWERPLQVNALEIISVIISGYIIIWILQKLIASFKKKEPAHLTPQTIRKEFAITLVITLLLIHFTILPIAIFIDDGMQLNDYVIANIITSLFMLLYFSVVRGNQYLQRYVQQKIELEKITNDQLQTELKFLKAQYHPHFLFNALNTIYFQMDENVAAAKKTIEKFSELLRYQLYDQHQTVPIKQELQYMQNFMDIQKIRTSEKLQLDTTIDTALQEQQVYPLLLLPLVENAFKYVGGAYEINIKARATKDGILFITENTLPTTPISEKANGIGLENLRRRLELLYPNRHELLIKKDKDHYHTSLQLIIQS